MRKLFLYGDFSENFRTTCKHFVTAAGGHSARIALLMQGVKGWKDYFTRYEQDFKYHGAKQVIPIFPEGNSTTLNQKAIDDLRNASGIFMCGGYTYRYIKIYTQKECAAIIADKYQIGVPYGGLSAGAILSVRLGFLKSCAIKPHFSEKKRFLELMNKMKTSTADYGLGIDAAICLEIINEQDVKVCGKGKLYLFIRLANNHYDLKIYRPNSSFVCDMGKIEEN